MIDDAFDGFSHALRILLEANRRAHELLFLDPHEASGNIEQSLTSVLNAFHSFYDIAKGVASFDWYGTAETATILSIRNARHHNIANRIRGIYAYHLQRSNPEDPRPYVYVNYPETEDGGTTFDVPVSWGDMQAMLSLPPEEVRLRSSAIAAIQNYLNFGKMNLYASAHCVDIGDVFFNINPLIVNAAIKFVPTYAPFMNPRSLESRIFLDHFQGVLPADTHTHVVNEFRVFLPAE